MPLLGIVPIYLNYIWNCGESSIFIAKNEWQGMVSPQLMIQAIEPLTEEPITLSTEGLRQMYVIVKQAMRGRSQSVYNVEQEILRRKPADQNNRSALTSHRCI